MDKMQGWLTKRGFFGIGSNRFCKLQGTQLIISKDEELLKVDTTIEITPQCSISIIENEKNYRFKITPVSGSSTILEASSNNDMMYWVLQLRGVTFFNPDITMDDFEIVSVIGRGYFGKVMLVKSKTDNCFYAIKSIHKSRLIKQNKVHSVIAERNILTKSNHPFVVSLKFAFQTSSKFYFVLEYVSGGELFYHIQRRKKLPFSEIRLILAQIILAFEHLHSIGIVYRDLKPENILLDQDGYVKLTDFGLSKDLTVDDTTSTYCGTPEYMAPEIILKRSYGKAVDWWALGILAYELFFGRSPFANSNPKKLFRNILEKDPKFPPDVDPVISDFILVLLKKEPEERPSYSKIVTHQLFAGISFNDLFQKKIKPEFRPVILSNNNPSNFDQEFTKESPVDSYVSPVNGSVEKFPGFSFCETNQFQPDPSILTVSSENLS